MNLKPWITVALIVAAGLRSQAWPQTPPHNARFQSWSVVSSHPEKLGIPVPARWRTSETTRYAQVAPFALKSVRLVYANWCSLQLEQGTTGEFPMPNQITVRAGIQVHLPGTSINDSATEKILPVRFSGQLSALVGGGASLISDPVALSVPAGGTFFVRTFVDSTCPPAPPAPTLTEKAGTSKLSAGAYTVCITHYFANSRESLASAGANLTIHAGNQIIVSGPPSGPSGALGYRVYLSQVGSTSPTYSAQSGTVPFGTTIAIQNPFLQGVAVSALGVKVPGATEQYPAGGGTMGGTGPGSANNGEGYVANVDDSTSGVIAPTTDLNHFGPVAVLGLAADGAEHPSVAIIGDSIACATADTGFGVGRGGFVARALMGQYGRAYNAAIPPAYGYMQLAQGSELAANFAGQGGRRRSQIASLCTSVVSDYGTNDLLLGSAPLLGNTLLIADRFTSQHQTFFQTTLTPRCLSTDGWQTVQNQFTVGAEEGFRRQFNSWLLSNDSAKVVGAESPFVVPLLPQRPGADFYAGGNGISTDFIPRNVFLSQSEQVWVAGLLQQPNRDYQELFQTTILGQVYASGIRFPLPPFAGATVTLSYSAIGGFKSLAGSLADRLDTASLVEVDSQGSFGTNGGWWYPSAGLVQQPRLLTSVGDGYLTDLTASWSQDQFRGLMVEIVSDPLNPAAAGQCVPIAANDDHTIQFLVGSWRTTPSILASYEIIYGASFGGIHPTTVNHIRMAHAIDTSKFQLR